MVGTLGSGPRSLNYSTPDNNIKIYNDDYLEVKLDDKADLIITSPPYNEIVVPVHKGKEQIQSKDVRLPIEEHQ